MLEHQPIRAVDLDDNREAIEILDASVELTSVEEVHDDREMIAAGVVEKHVLHVGLSRQRPGFSSLCHQRTSPRLRTPRVARRVDEQFARGIVREVRDLLDRGVPPTARPFGGLVYRQVMEMLAGVRGEVETRALIVRENQQYARRQLIWFRKEPTLMWFEGPGERDGTRQHVEEALAARGVRRRGDVR